MHFRRDKQEDIEPHNVCFIYYMLEHVFNAGQLTTCDVHMRTTMTQFCVESFICVHLAGKPIKIGGTI